MPKLDNQTILLAFAVVTGLAVVLQTIFLLAILIAVRKTAKSLRHESEKLRSALMPVVYDSREILASMRDTLTSTQDFLATTQAFAVRILPKVETATGELAEIAHNLREQSVKLQASVQEIAERVQKQSSRVDGMVTSALDSVDRAGGFVADAISGPVRQVSGILRSTKAIIETLRAPSRR